MGNGQPRKLRHTLNKIKLKIDTGVKKKWAMGNRDFIHREERMNEKINWSIGLVMVSVLFMSGCATFSPSGEVFKEKANINSRIYDAPINACFDVLKQVVLKQNFSLASEDKEAKKLQATRYFQKGRRSIVIVLNANLQSLGENKTTLYLNAVQTTEKLYAQSHSRFFLGIIPLPGGGGETAQRLKEGEITVEDKKFYEGFFDEIGDEIRKLKGTGEGDKKQG